MRRLLHLIQSGSRKMHYNTKGILAVSSKTTDDRRMSERISAIIEKPIRSAFSRLPKLSHLSTENTPAKYIIMKSWPFRIFMPFRLIIFIKKQYITSYLFGRIRDDSAKGAPGTSLLESSGCRNQSAAECRPAMIKDLRIEIARHGTIPPSLSGWFATILQGANRSKRTWTGKDN